MLAHYFQPEQSAEVAEAVLTDWVDALRDVPKDGISEACRVYLRDQPRRRPTPGEIRQKAFGWMKAQGLIHAPRLGTADDARLALPQPERSTDEKARALGILDKAGFTPKRFQAVENRRMASSEAELYGDTDKHRPVHWSETTPSDDPRWDALRRAREGNALMQAARRDSEAAE